MFLVAVLEDFEEAVMSIDFDIVESFWDLHESYNLEIKKILCTLNNIIIFCVYHSFLNELFIFKCVYFLILSNNLKSKKNKISRYQILI